MAAMLHRFVAVSRNYPKCLHAHGRLISMSNKSKDTTTVEPIVKPKYQATEEKITQTKDWVSYGFDYKSEADDRIAAHLLWFTGLTCCIVGGCFIVRYWPDYKLKDWAVREAFLELHRREKEGLPLIDEDLIARDKIILPSDEELGDTEIII